ncbi:MAG: ATP-binding protein [Pseudomonadota bacterium]
MTNAMQALAPDALNALREEAPTAELESAFRLFNDLSLRLEEAYGELEGRVASLDAELRIARQEREVQRAQKEQLAARMAGLLKELPVGVVLVGSHGRVEESNRAADSMLRGLRVGIDWETVVLENRLGANNGAQSNANDETDAGSGFMLPQRRRITLTRRELGGGACVVVLTDVTQIHELQERVGRNQRLSEMGEMAARLAHQIRTPVASAMLFASSLERSPDTGARRNGGRILERLRHLETLVNDMLRFARGDLGQLERLTARKLIDAVLFSVDPRLGDALEVQSSPDDTVAVLANRDMLAGAVTNLIGNASECGASRIELAARVSSEGFLEVTVADDGPGIPEAVAGRIFEPFFTTRSGGTGLGLAVVRSAVEAFGGSVHHEAAALGGARFVLRLPTEDLPVDGLPASPLTPGAAGSDVADAEAKHHG